MLGHHHAEINYAIDVHTVPFRCIGKMLWYTEKAVGMFETTVIQISSNYTCGKFLLSMKIFKFDNSAKLNCSRCPAR